VARRPALSLKCAEAICLHRAVGFSEQQVDGFVDKVRELTENSSLLHEFSTWTKLACHESYRRKRKGGWKTEFRGLGEQCQLRFLHACCLFVFPTVSLCNENEKDSPGVSSFTSDRMGGSPAKDF
jgi:hypothetical protein